MRCLKCNVDLPDSYSLCPLCGEKASEQEAVLGGFPDAPYPNNAPILPMEQEEKPKTEFSFEKLKAFFNR